MQWKYHQIHVKRFAKSEYIYIIYGWKRGSLKAFHLITSSNSEEVPTGPTQLQEVLANQVSTVNAFKICCLSDRIDTSYLSILWRRLGLRLSLILCTSWQYPDGIAMDLFQGTHHGNATVASLADWNAGESFDDPWYPLKNSRTQLYFLSHYYTINPYKIPSIPSIMILMSPSIKSPWAFDNSVLELTTIGGAIWSGQDTPTVPGTRRLKH